ncbi:MAG: cyclic pyranopterin monophosphate synthase MoaC [Slackia sp.]
MEALTAASVACLTVYDMCKADRGMEMWMCVSAERRRENGTWELARGASNRPRLSPPGAMRFLRFRFLNKGRAKRKRFSRAPARLGLWLTCGRENASLFPFLRFIRKGARWAPFALHAVS